MSGPLEGKDSFYVSRARVEKIRGVHRRAHLEAGATVDFGVHGAIKEHYRLHDAQDLPLPVDYLVAGTGAWLLGTLNGALEAREIRLPPDAIRATVEGTNEVRDRIPVLTRVHVSYRLRIPRGAREVVDRTLARHVEKCPTAQTLQGAVEVTWEAEIEEV